MEPEIINPTSFLSEFSKSQKTVDTKDVLPYEFDQGMGELNKYDVGLTPYIPKEENRAQNQDWWQSIRNSLSQLVSGTIGEIVATPGYIAGTFEPIEEMDKGISGLFIEAGEWIKQQGQEFAPLYRSQASREKIFAPWDSEWMAQTIADFGPTVALLASVFFTEGLTTPRLLSLGRQIPGISKYARAAQIFKNESKIYKKLRTVNTTLFSRMAENGMEAYQTFNEVYDGLKSSNPEMSDEDMRKLAGEAGSKVWRENWALIVLDYMQFGALLNGFGKLGKAFGILGKAFGLGEQMASGAFEEGLQYTMQAEAKNEIDFKTGKADRDKTFVETFIEGLTDPEMQKAMVQGALGGAVFQGMGAIANKIGERYRQPLSQSTSEVVNDIVKRGYADVAKADIDKKIAETDDPKLKKHLEGVKASIDKAVEVHQSENPNKDETAKALIKTQVLNNEKTDIEQKIESKKTDTTIQNKSAVDYAKASLASPHLNTLRKKYSKFPKALSIIDKLEQKYNNQRDTLASPEVTDEATHLIPQMRVDVHKAVELELEEEIQKQVATDLAEGNRELHDNLVKEDVKTHISNYTDKEELLKLRESETDAENKKVINSRIKELWQSESKVFPTIEQGADVWAEHYRENLFTFKNDAKNLFKQPNLTIEDFKNKFEEFKPLLEERQKSEVADQKRAVSLEQKDKTKIIDIVGKDEKGLTIKQINQRTGKQDKTNLVEQLVNEGLLIREGNRYKKVEVEDDVPIIVEHSKEEPQPDDIPFDPQWARSNDMLFYAATEVDGKWYITYSNKTVTLEEYEKLGFDKPILKTGWYPVTKDKEPVKWHQTDVDVEFLRKVYEITGKPLDQHEVHIKVDWNYTNGNWKNRDANKDNFKIYYVIKHDGKEHIIGEVPAYKSGMEEELKSFRYTLYEHAKQEENDYEYPHTLKVKATRPGRVWNTKSRNSDLTISDRGINLGVYSDGKIYGIEQTNLDRVDREDIKSFEGKLTEGAVYWFITHPVTGKIVPIRLFTRKVKDLPNVEKKIKHILAGVNKDNWVDKRREVSRYVKWGTKEKRQPDFGFNKSGELIVNGEVTPIPDGAVIQDVIYDTLDIGDRTIQVDTRRINTKGYNEMLMNEGYIQTDVNQINPFHSPKFKVDYTELKQVELKEQVSVQEAAVSKKANLESKKADIERRRKENPSVERGVLINFESGKTKEQLIDIVSKLKEGKITFDEIVKEFFNLPVNTLSEVKKAFNEGTLADKIQFGLDVNELSEVQSKTRSKEEVIKSRQKALSEKQKAETALKDSEYKIVKKKELITGKVTETKVKRTVEEKAKYEDYYRKIIEDTNKQIEEYDAELKALENNATNEIAQPEQAQETTQGQTIETNVQPEQGATTTEQGVSSDIEAKKADIERRRQEELKRPYNNKKQELANIQEIASYGETYSEALDNLIKKQEEVNDSLNKRQKEDTKDRSVKQYTKEELEAQPEWNEIKRLNKLMDLINDVYGSAYGFNAKIIDGIKEVEEELKELPNKRKTADAKINAKYDAELAALESDKKAESSKDNTEQVPVENKIPTYLQYIIDQQVETAKRLGITKERVEELNNQDLTAKEIARQLIQDDPKLAEFKDNIEPKGVRSIEALVRAIRAKYFLASLDDKRESNANRQRSLNEIKESYDKSADLNIGVATLYNLDGTTATISDIADVTKSDKFWRLKQNINNFYNEQLKSLSKPISTDLPEDILQQISNNALFKLESQHYTTKLWNQKEGQKWLKDKFGEEAIVLSQEELNDLADRLGYVAQRGGKNLWGFVHQGMVYMSELAPESVHRHEAYHLIHNYVLTDSERRAIEKFGTEEEIADAFMEYMQTEDAPYAAWKRVFKKIYLFFKRILALDKMTLDEFFWTFENSTYNSVSFKKNVEVFRPKVEEIHPTIKKQRIRLINKIFLTALGDLKKDNPNLKTEDLFRLALGKEDLYGTKVMDRLNEMELNIDNNWKSGVYEDFKLANGTIIPAEQIYRARKAQIKQVKDNLYKDGKPQQWYYDAVEDLRRYGVFVNTIGGKDIVEGEEDGLETWMKENVKSPAFDSFTFNLKVMLTDIPDAEYVSVADKDKPHVKEYRLGNKTVYIKTKKDSFNQTVYMDGDEIYAKLLQHLSDSLSQEDMMNKLEDMSYDYPWAKILYDDLSSENGDYLSGNLNQLKSEMYYRFAQWANTQSIVITPVDGEFRLGYSNEKTLKSNLIREWWDKVNSPSNPLFENKEKQAQTISVLNKLNVSPNSSQKDVAAIVKTMNAVGIETTDEIVKAIVKENKGQSLQKALVQVVEGNKKGVEIIAGLIKKFYPEYYQPSYVNVEGEKVQNHIRASFMSRQIEKFNRSEGMEVYEGDPFYNSAYDESVQNVEDALWLDRFKTKKGIISFNLVDGFGGVSSKTFADFTPLEFLAYQMGAFYNNGNYKVKSNSENGQAYYSVQLFADSSSHSLIGMETYSKKDILTKLTQVAFNEYDAIQEGVNGVKGYTPKFNFFPFFNQMSESELADVFSNRESVKRMIEKNVTEWIKKEKRTLGEKGFYRQIKDRYEFLDNRIDNVDEFLEDFYWNDIYAQTQIISLFYGNLSYYNNINNFYKRAKEIWAPGDFLDTTRINKEYFIAIVPDVETTNQEVVDFVNKHLEGVGVRYENSSETDGQGIIDIDRWREIQLGKGADLDWVNGIYDRVAQGVETETDMEYIFMPYKPFMYDLVKHNGQVVPLQDKNAEVVLLPSMAKNNPKLQTILNKLKEVREKTGLNGSLQFDTTVKVGEHNSNKSIETIDNWIILKNSEYRIQGETPEHQVDTDNLLGTQLRKIATGDLELDGDYRVGEETVKGKAIKEEMNSILKADVEANAKSLRERFKSKEEFYKSLQEEAISRNYPKKIIDALEPIVKPDGTVGTKLPLYHPLLIKKAFALIASLYRNKITKLKFPGASLPNVTSYGLERKPRVVFNEDGSIQHLECYMPMTNRWLRDYMDKNGFLNVDKLAEFGLDLGVAYRIPTEGKYSMVPIKVIGFTNAGIILPPEITKMTGLDFDIDKMYVMLYSFDIVNGVPVKSKWESEPSYADYKTRVLNTKRAKELIKEYETADAILSNAEGLSDKLRELFLSNSVEDLLIENDILMDESEWNKLSVAERNSKKARDNRKLDLLRAVLTSPHTFKSQMDGGNFEALEKLAHEVGGEFPNVNPLLASERSRVFENMMAGKALIGIGANYVATHQLMQDQNIELVEPLEFDGRVASDLGAKYVTGTNDIVTAALAQFNASFVDNGKNPLAGLYNMNTYTADVAMLFTKLFGWEAAVRFISHPAVKDFYTRYVNAGGDFRAEQKIIDEIFPQVRFTGEKRRKPLPLTMDMLVNKTDGQDVLYAFLYYKKNQAKQLGDLVTAMKVADAGMSSTVEDTLVSLDAIEKAKENDGIKGVIKYFENEALHTTSMVNLGIIEPLDRLRDELEFPDYRQGAYKEIRDVFNSEKESGKLNAKEIRFIHDVMMNFMASSFDMFKFNRKAMVKSILPIIEKAKKDNPDNSSKYRKLLSSIKTSASREDSGLQILKLDNGISYNAENDIMEQWEMMFSDSSLIPETDITYSRFAKALVKYAFITKGFRFGPGSFSQVTPINFYAELKNEGGVSFTDYIGGMIRLANSDSQSMNNFISQIVRNYFPRLSFVRTVNTEQDVIKKDKEGNIVAILADDRYAKNGFFPSFVKYKDDNKKWHLFQNESENKYVPITPLGLYNEVEEWDAADSNPSSDFRQPVSKDVIKATTKISSDYKPVATPVGEAETKDVDLSIKIISKKLFNAADKTLKKGSVVEYNGKKYLFWNENQSGKAQLINTDGTKFSGTPGIDKLVTLGSYPTVMYNNTEYIVTDNNNVYSGATGNLVYTGVDNSSKVQKQRIIDAAKEQVSAAQSEPVQGEGSTEVSECIKINKQ